MSRKYGIKGLEAIQLGKLLFLKSIMVGYNDVDYVFKRIKYTFYGRKKYVKAGRREFGYFLLRLKRRYGIYYQDRVVDFSCDINVNTQLFRAAIKHYELFERRCNSPKLEVKRRKAIKRYYTNNVHFDKIGKS